MGRVFTTYRGIPSKGINPAWAGEIPCKAYPYPLGLQDTLRGLTLTTPLVRDYPLGITLTPRAGGDTLVGRCLPYVLHVGCRQGLTLYKGMNPPTILTLCRQGLTPCRQILTRTHARADVTRTRGANSGENGPKKIGGKTSQKISGEKRPQKIRGNLPPLTAPKIIRGKQKGKIKCENTTR